MEKILPVARNRNVPSKNSDMANAAMPVSYCCRAMGSADSALSAGGGNARLTKSFGHLLAFASPVVATPL